MPIHGRIYNAALQAEGLTSEDYDGDVLAADIKSGGFGSGIILVAANGRAMVNTYHLPRRMIFRCFEPIGISNGQEDFLRSTSGHSNSRR